MPIIRSQESRRLMAIIDREGRNPRPETSQETGRQGRTTREALFWAREERLQAKLALSREREARLRRREERLGQRLKDLERQLAEVRERLSDLEGLRRMREGA